MQNQELLPKTWHSLSERTSKTERRKYHYALFGVVFALAGCGGSPCASVQCPVTARTASLFYNSTVGVGSGFPLVFNTTGKQVTVTMQIFNGGTALPLMAVNGSALGSCKAAELQIVPTPGSIIVKSKTPGSCDFKLSSGGVSQTLSVVVQ